MTSPDRREDQNPENKPVGSSGRSRVGSSALLRPSECLPKPLNLRRKFGSVAGPETSLASVKRSVTTPIASMNCSWRPEIFSPTTLSRTLEASPSSLRFWSTGAPAEIGNREDRGQIHRISSRLRRMIVESIESR